MWLRSSSTSGLRHDAQVRASMDPETGPLNSGNWTSSPDPQVDRDRPTIPDLDDDPLMSEEEGGGRDPALNEDQPRE